MNNIPGKPYVSRDQYDIDGIRVERFTIAPKDTTQRPPLICVHGGCHASWSWQEHAAVYAAAGYEVHALNWSGRGGSAAVNSFRRKRAATRQCRSLLPQHVLDLADCYLPRFVLIDGEVLEGFNRSFGSALRLHIRLQDVDIIVGLLETVALHSFDALQQLAGVEDPLWCGERVGGFWL